MLKSRRCLGLLVLLVAVAASSVASAQPPTITLENGRSAAGLSGRAGAVTYFRISVPTRAAFLEVAASGGQGDCDLYVRHGQYPTSREHDFRSIGPTTADRVKIDRPQAGLWYVMVFGGGNYANVSLRAHFPVPGGGPVRIVPLTNNVVRYGLSGGTGSAAYFKIDVPPGATDLKITTSGGSGDCDLFVSTQAAFTRQTAAHKSTGDSTAEAVAVARPAPGTWYVLLFGYSPFRDVKLLAQYRHPGGGMHQIEVLASGILRRGVAGAEGSARQFRIDVPPRAGELVVTTTAGRGDCDLFVDPKPIVDPRAAQHNSRGNTAAEQITIARPAPGTWYILVYGYSAYADVGVVAIVKRSGPGHPPARLVITAPTRGPLQAGTRHLITWQASRGIRTVRLEYSTDDGRTWSRANFPRELAALAGRHFWDIPADRNYASTRARLRLLATRRDGQVIQALSERLVVLPPRPPRPARLDITFPAGGETLHAGQTYTVTWRASPRIRFVKIEYSADDGKVWWPSNFPTKPTIPAAAGKYVWQVPPHRIYQSATVRLRLTGISDRGTAVSVVSQRFRVLPPAPAGRIDILAPAGGALRLGQACTIRWRAAPGVRSVQIDFSVNDGRTWIRGNLPNRLAASAGQHVWQIPAERGYLSPQARLRITGTQPGGRTVTATSKRFQILPPGPGRPHGARLDITWPAGGEKVYAGRTYTVTWRASSGIRTVKIEYSYDDGKTWVRSTFPPDASIPAAAGKYVWQVPPHRIYQSGAARLRITGTGQRGKAVSVMSQRFQLLAAPRPRR